MRCPEHALGLGEVMRWWTWDPLATLAVVVGASVYTTGVLRLWRHAGAGHGVKRWHVAAYATGVAIFYLALCSPVDRLSDLFFAAHMTQHEILMLGAAPLIVLGRPLYVAVWALPRRTRERLLGAVARKPVQRAWRTLTAPLVVLGLHALALWLWHLPVLFDAALDSEAVHAFQHACFFVTAALFFWALWHGRYGRVGYALSALLVFVTATHQGVLGAILGLAGRVLYPGQERVAEHWGVMPLEDQRLAGMIMWVPTGIIFLAVALVLLAAWLREGDRLAARRDADRRA